MDDSFAACIHKIRKEKRIIMKYLKQFLIILILFIGLLSGVIKLSSVKEAGSFLIEIMPVMFIPAGVGLMSSWLNLKPIIIPVCIITVAAIFTVMIVSGHVTQFIVKRTKKNDEY